MGCCFPLLGRAEVAGQKESLVKVVEGGSADSWVLVLLLHQLPEVGLFLSLGGLLQYRKILMLTGSLENEDISVVGRQ